MCKQPDVEISTSVAKMVVIIFIIFRLYAPLTSEEVTRFKYSGMMT